ncbi:MAG: hypothetical protein H6737_06740 [Alphaproteobacteria bacterium]|nr:hypothetical protein [Alphaproteobacteria bacterium]
MLLLHLSACLFLGSEDLRAVSDLDGDGYIAGTLGGDDCDDAAPEVHPGAPDAPYDGVDANCDGSGDYDADGDGLDAYEFGGADCDDSTPTVRADPVEWVPDCDGDGVPKQAAVRACGTPVGVVAEAAASCAGGGPPEQWIRLRPDQAWDCDDDAPEVSPNRVDTPYNGIDDDCDGENDFDVDNDGYVAAGQGVGVTDADAPFTGDCDDNDPSVRPGAIEVWYDGVDGNCAGDDDFDADHDGYSTVSPTEPDCNDADPSIHPGAEEVWYDGVDDDCDGTDDDQDGDGWARAEDCDDEDPTRYPGAPEVWYDGIDGDCAGDNDFDADHDGFVVLGSPGSAGGTAPFIGDCDDTAASVNPDAAEVWYDGADGDCAGDNDYDADHDGFVRAGFASEADPRAPGTDDCDDTDGARNPGAPEAFYDGIDSDCGEDNDYDADGDGAVPAEYAAEAGGTAPRVGDCDDADPLRADHFVDIWYDGIDADCGGNNDFDADSDGYVAEEHTARAGGSAPFTGDCDDFAPLVHPDAVDFYYDGIDADCDGENDFDLDRDGYASALYPGQQGGTAPAGGDCNDGNPVVNPGRDETFYDGIDSDCDGFNDFDADRDGFVRRGFESKAGGTATNTGDCADDDPNAHPGGFEIYYDGVDGDCDDRNDYDADGDGHLAIGYEAFATPGLRTGDCDDLEPAAFPGNVDVLYDGIDGDCDGFSDFDGDRDGYDWDAFGGLDCNDADPFVAPGQPDAPYDGLDRDCDGWNDYDADKDGVISAAYDASVAGGTSTELGDCDDTNPAVATPANREVGANDDLKTLLERTCPGDTVFLAPVTHTLTSAAILGHDLTIVGPARIRGAGDRLIDLTAGALVLQDLDLEGGATTGDGGCLRMAAGTALDVVGGSFEGCTAGGDGGAIHATNAGVALVGTVLSDNAASNGGAIHGSGLDLALVDVLSEGNRAAADGGMLHLVGNSVLEVRDTDFASDVAQGSGGALFVAGTPRLAAFDTVRFQGTAAAAGALTARFEDLRGLGGDNDPALFTDVDVVALRIEGYTCVFGACAEPPEAAAGFELVRSRRVRVENLTLTGGVAHDAIRVLDPVRDTVFHDLEISGVQALAGLYHRDGGSCQSGCPFTVTNALVRSLKVFPSPSPLSAGFEVDRFIGTTRLDQISIGYTIAEGLHLICTNSCSLEVRNSVFSESFYGSNGNFAIWFFATGSGLQVYDSHAVGGSDFFSFTAGYVDPWGAQGVTRREDADAFLVPVPGFDAHLDPSDPIVLQGTSTNCASSANPDCGHPGFWGGVERPR